jgi:hypothetical protein
MQFKCIKKDKEEILPKFELVFNEVKDTRSLRKTFRISLKTIYIFFKIEPRFETYSVDISLKKKSV